MYNDWLRCRHVSAEDVAGNDEGGFKDLVKFWKKHGIPIPKALLSDMADENGKPSAMTITGSSSVQCLSVCDYLHQ